ncbi:MAG: hypothetical protein ACKOGP_00750, partial [Bacteroidota bacterium]
YQMYAIHYKPSNSAFVCWISLLRPINIGLPLLVLIVSRKARQGRRKERKQPPTGASPATCHPPSARHSLSPAFGEASL